MFGEIENELVALIQQSSLGDHLRTVEALPDLSDDTLINRLRADAPAVYVAISTPIRIEGDVMYPRVGLAAIAHWTRGAHEARQGSPVSVGVYDMMDTLLALLNGARTNASAWRVVGAGLLNSAALYGAGLYGGSVQIEGRMTLPDYVQSDALAAFERFTADWDMAPSDEQIDAQDNVTPEQ